MREPGQRVPVPSGGDSVPSSSDTAFFFAPEDTDRVLVVDLGRARRVHEVGVELFPVPGVGFVDAVGRYVRRCCIHGLFLLTL